MKLSSSLIAKLEALRLQELETGSLVDATDLEAVIAFDEDGAYEQGFQDGRDDCDRDHCDNGYCRPSEECCDCEHADGK